MALSFQGLKALGVPEESLASFPPEFQQGMAARAAELGDTGESAPEHWEQPLGRPDVHLGDLRAGPGRRAPGERRSPAPATPCGMCRASRRSGSRTPTCCRTSGPRSGSRTASATRPSRAAASPPPTRTRTPFKAGEFVLGYPNENGDLPPRPSPRCSAATAATSSSASSTPAWRRSASTSRARAESRAEEELLAAKFVGRWPSGAPLVLAPERDDPELGADPERNNAFLYVANDDARGLKCPLGAHARRTNPRDSKIIGVARMHRIIRRSSSYGPMLPEGVLEDDGADRGILFFCLQARLDRGFEFVKTQWINDGTFFGAPAEMDPLVGPNDGTRRFTVPQQPIRRRLTELPQFVVNRGGEYLLHARPAGAALARRARHVGRSRMCGPMRRARCCGDSRSLPPTDCGPNSGCTRTPPVALGVPATAISPRVRRCSCRGTSAADHPPSGRLRHAGLLENVRWWAIRLEGIDSRTWSSDGEASPSNSRSTIASRPGSASAA